MLEHEGIKGYSYEDICHTVFEERLNLQKNEAIVLKVFDRLQCENGQRPTEEPRLDIAK